MSERLVMNAPAKMEIDKLIRQLATAQKENERLKEFWKPAIKKFETKFPNAGNANTLALTALTEAFDIHCRNEHLEQVVLEMSAFFEKIKFTTREDWTYVDCTEALTKHSDLISEIKGKSK